jgi:hypothetical protein
MIVLLRESLSGFAERSAAGTMLSEEALRRVGILGQPARDAGPALAPLLDLSRSPLATSTVPPRFFFARRRRREKVVRLVAGRLSVDETASRRRFVSNSANTASMLRKHLPAAVLMSIGRSVVFKRRAGLAAAHNAVRNMNALARHHPTDTSGRAHGHSRHCGPKDPGRPTLVTRMLKPNAASGRPARPYSRKGRAESARRHAADL